MSENQITVQPTTHKGKKRLKLLFTYNEAIIDKIRTIPSCRWSATMHCWHVADEEGMVKRINFVLRGHTLHYGFHNKPQPRESDAFVNDTSWVQKPSINEGYIREFEEYLKFRRFSKNTVEIYISAVKIFFRFIGNITAKEITQADVIRFNNSYILRNGYSFNYQNQIISALKLFFNRSGFDLLDVDSLERPFRPKRLPVVLSVQEVEKILNSISNIKHKALISLIYSGGLRIGEAVNLKIADIDSQRGLICIRSAKGNKDRIVTLSVNLLTILRKYVKACRPKEYLFNGTGGGTYSRASIRKVFSEACKRAGIRKNVRVHTLRHSFATHMLEKGVDVRYIQEMLGHASVKTTMIYTHVSQRKFNFFVNPLDELKVT